MQVAMSERENEKALLERGRREDSESSGDKPRFRNKKRQDSFGPGVLGLPFSATPDAGVSKDEEEDVEEEDSSSDIDIRHHIIQGRREAAISQREITPPTFVREEKKSPSPTPCPTDVLAPASPSSVPMSLSSSSPTDLRLSDQGKEKEETLTPGGTTSSLETLSSSAPLAKASAVPRSTPKLGKLLGTDPMSNPRMHAAQQQQQQQGGGGNVASSPEDGGQMGGGGVGGQQQQANNLNKISKFFGTVISNDTANALQSKSKGKTARGGKMEGFGSDSPMASSPATASPPMLSPAIDRTPSQSQLTSSGNHNLQGSNNNNNNNNSMGAPAANNVRRRRASSAGIMEGNSSWRSLSNPSDTIYSEEPKQSSGRVSMTFWRPSGASSKERFWFEVALDYVTVLKSPTLERKKPEWSCNVCCDASLDSIIVVRLRRPKDDDAADKCHVSLKGLVEGHERSVFLEFPSGARQQMTLLPLDFGHVPVVSDEIRSGSSGVVAFDTPNVLDVLVTDLHDVWAERKGPLTLQVMYSELTIRSNRLTADPDSSHLAEIMMDCTFRLCPAATEFYVCLMQGESFPGELVASARVNLKKLDRRKRTHIFPLRDVKMGRPRAFVQCKVSVSAPSAGVLSHFGPAMVGIPMRMDWGDVVFFNMKSLNAQIVSAATASSWDHCGIIYEEDGKMFLLEAVSGGVQSPELYSRVLDSMSQGNKIGFRRYNGVRTPELKAELWSFAIGMTGRSYKKSVGQLVGSRWGRNKADDLSSVFCSELVAAAFKQCGFLDESVVVSNFTPKDLASSDFVLKKGSLGPLVSYSEKVRTLLSNGRFAAELQNRVYTQNVASASVSLGGAAPTSPRKLSVDESSE